ncbi:hypothetical protein F5X96DRAFT_540550 [Biscogniauxia mediterranea]|nr:hypothetical protein F5X96DRAFT_540550 [Biscogniauxia mediterranea]
MYLHTYFNTYFNTLTTCTYQKFPTPTITYHHHQSSLSPSPSVSFFFFGWIFCWSVRLAWSIHNPLHYGRTVRQRQGLSIESNSPSRDTPLALCRTMTETKKSACLVDITHRSHSHCTSHPSPFSSNIISRPRLSPQSLVTFSNNLPKLATPLFPTHTTPLDFNNRSPRYTLPSPSSALRPGDKRMSTISSDPCVYLLYVEGRSLNRHSDLGGAYCIIAA